MGTILDEDAQTTRRIQLAPLRVRVRSPVLTHSSRNEATETADAYKDFDCPQEAHLLNKSVW